MGEGVQVVPGSGSEHRDERMLGHGGHRADGVEPAFAELVGRDRTDAPETAHVERMEELELAVGIDDEQPVRLADPAGHLGEELGPGDADGDGQADLVEHPSAETCRDLGGRAADAPRGR